MTELRNKIPVACLTKTFREAMEMTVRMGIRYLWIDSLCIIQDSEEDWKRESKMMGAIYEHAFCNIAAAKASIGDEGLFTHRPLFDVKPCIVDIKETSLGPITMFVKDEKYTEFDSFDSKDPLHLRAWVTQEWIMSPRVLHFGRYQSCWQCLEFSAPEASHRGVWQSNGKITLIPELYLVQQSDFDIWGEVVAKYTAGDLTYPAKDKLMAISAIAKKLCNGDTYLAGLWRDRLPEQLLWTTALGCHRADSWRAPSWSWASLDGRIFYRRPRIWPRHTLIRVFDAKVTPAEGVTDAFGPVCGGFIHLSADLIKILYEDNFTGPALSYAFYLDTETLQASRTLVCMFVESEYDYSYAQGLLLERTTGPRGEYRRIGTFEVQQEENYEILPSSRWFGSIVHGRDTNYPVLELTEDDYESIDEPSEDGVEMYRITLV
ncbi:MAG: hypothetical protein LQ350_003558 [Teloschistes chrysophthalmus]|nr:MAG: hypothetical protein LQ350_003558 [Niorma chrysophthalma]